MGVHGCKMDGVQLAVGCGGVIEGEEGVVGLGEERVLVVVVVVVVVVVGKTWCG